MVRKDSEVTTCSKEWGLTVSFSSPCNALYSVWLSHGYPFIGKCSVTANGPQPLRSRFRHWSCHARIATDLQLKLPDRNAIIKDSPLGKIGMYTRFVEFANFHIPLLKFLLCVLEYYQITLLQLSVIDAAKISHFELMCHVVGRVPTVVTFCHFYVNSISNG
nr:putative transposase (putative), gypsy type [Tanacetum cinerariifolium]